jgi:hypothetical protein
MNPGNIAALAAGAGFAGNDVDIATAVAMAESDGNPQAYNPEGSYGLWQIYLTDHPEFANWNLYDPQTNARAAYQVYAKAGGRFTPWSAYKNGSFRQFLPTAAPAPPPLVLDGATGQPVDPSLYAAAAMAPPGQTDSSGLSFGKVLLFGVLGFFALWLFEEAT